MIVAVTGAGGKTSLIKELTAHYREMGKTVFVTTTTHMLIEEDTLLTEDARCIVEHLNKNGYAMAGVPVGEKIGPLPEESYREVCCAAEVVLVEADGSRHCPVKYPNEWEPVIPENAEEILVVCGLQALGHPLQEVCHRPELAKKCLGTEETVILTPELVQKLVTEGYLKSLRERHPDKKVRVIARHDGTLYQRVIAALLENEADVSKVKKEWFCPQPTLIICGGGHVAREAAAMASCLDFRVKVIDDRKELITEERFPTVNERICDSFENLEQYLEPGAYYVVVTPHHKADYQCVRKVLSTDYSYLGMIGSRNKVADTVKKLREEGFLEEQLQRLFAPIGLPIGAVTPAEIAVSILAQIIQEKNKKHAASADRELLEYRGDGVLCVITEKHGSAPRGVGSMMLIGKDRIYGSIGGGEAEYLAIEHVKKDPSFAVRSYRLINRPTEGLDMICGGTIEVLFLPLAQPDR